MKQHLYIYITVLTLFIANNIIAQDIHLTQYYVAPLYLNPAFTGSNICSRFSMSVRNQWPQVSSGYKSGLVSGDHYLQKQNIGVGMSVAFDEAGSSQLRTTIINPSVAYEFFIDRGTSVRLGVQPGFGIRSVNYSKFLFGSDIVQGIDQAYAENKDIRSMPYFDANAGALFYNTNYYLGFSVFHLNTPNQSLLNGVSKLPMKYSVQGGYTHILNPENVKDILQQKSFNFAFHLRGQKKFDQLDIGTYYNYGMFTTGFWYRGIPLIKAYKPGYLNNDALAFIVGYRVNRINIGYSYDITISKLARSTSGAHELSVTYNYCPPKKKIKPRKRVACAKF